MIKRLSGYTDVRQAKHPPGESRNSVHECALGFWAWVGRRYPPLLSTPFLHLTRFIGGASLNPRASIILAVSCNRHLLMLERTSSATGLLQILFESANTISQLVSVQVRIVSSENDPIWYPVNKPVRALSLAGLTRPSALQIIGYFV